MKTVALHHESIGPLDAPPLLLGGSLGTTLAMWEPQVRLLSGRLRMIPFDHRGHGASPVPVGPYTIAELGSDVIALMDRLKLERASYCGLSIGGMVGQWLGGNHAERIDKLILIATSSYLGDPAPWLERAATVRVAGTVEGIADLVVSRWFTPHWATQHGHTVRTYRDMLASSAVEGYASCCEAISALDVRGELGRITAPTLVISGADDPAIPPQHQQAIANAIAGARLETIADAAHLTSVQRPAQVNQLIFDHLGL
ncbi:MAG TPA: 3-oxoadipate enol-lactonase [Solirubrobacteraceae bacterium]|nr:3-oxoadipate enol-lactonase [Solirubrobacteraceae bacterium]